MSESRHYRLAVLVLLLFGWVTNAYAQSCTIDAADVAFGGIDPLVGAAVDVSSTVGITCTKPLLSSISAVGVCIYLDEGSGGSDGSTYRYMRQAAEILQFNLYKDAARTQIWGSETSFPGSGAQRVTVNIPGGLLGGPGSLTVPVYGRVPGAVSDRPVGNYDSTFTGGARARYSTDTSIPCDGVAGTQAVDTFAVTGSIVETCTVEADDLTFGSQGALDTAVNATSQIRTSCSADLPYDLTLGPGGGGSYGSRRMQHTVFSGEQVAYQLYTDPARTLIWGDGLGGTASGGGTGSGSPQAATVYGQVPLQATPRPGDYQDSVVVTVSY